MHAVNTHLGTFTARDDTLADAIVAAVDGYDYDALYATEDTLARTFEPVL